LHLNVAAEKLLKHSPTADEGLVVRGELAWEVLQYFGSLESLAARPLD
jgi:hypothetical protein